MVFSLAFHALRNRALAQEVAQEAFFRLARNLDRLESPDHAVHWLRRTTVRLCIDELRRRNKRPMASLEEMEEPCEDPHDPDFLLHGHLRRMVADLPEKARMAVILRFQEGMEPAEIAAALDEPLPTIKSRLQRALASLREGLARIQEGGRR
jgi:RNA polymerase sigma-70 factor (ECF subfamily)